MILLPQSEFRSSKETEISSRPEHLLDVHPDKWIMIFAYSDKMSGGGSWSQPIPFNNKGEAYAAATNANRDHSGGGITVNAVNVYPPVGVEAEPFGVEF